MLLLKIVVNVMYPLLSVLSSRNVIIVSDLQKLVRSVLSKYFVLLGEKSDLKKSVYVNNNYFTIKIIVHYPNIVMFSPLFK